MVLESGPHGAPLRARRLALHWSASRRDSLLSADSDEAAAAGYVLVRPCAACAAAPLWIGGVCLTEPLDLWWHPEWADSWTAARSHRGTAEAAGYQFVRTEGHVFRSPVPGSIELRAAWSGARGDTCGIAHPATQHSCDDLCYVPRSVEGYLMRGVDAVPLLLFRRSSGEAVVVSSEAGQRAAAEAGFSLQRIVGTAERCPVPGLELAPLTLWRRGVPPVAAALRSCSGPEGEMQAAGDGFERLGCECWLPAADYPGTAPLRRWSRAAPGRSAGVDAVLVCGADDEREAAAEGYSDAGGHGEGRAYV
eukprot:TRINITY_DN35419_c0_g1_i1.p1 TRINITY_DN35419_c0_g1~~TRINITY_DN35419_c0_g1_i1.p1  ORF type:complete len:325 (+),score=83.24 TRINITY_DN35419_c0_g1_i1:55-975(+)